MKLKSSALVTVVLLALLGIFFIGKTLPTKPTPKQASPQTRSDAPSIQIVGQEDKNSSGKTSTGVEYSPYVMLGVGSPVIILKNVSKKPILSVSITNNGNLKNMQINMLNALEDGALDPGDVVTVSRTTKDFVIQAVAFDDGTGEGSDEALSYTLQYVRDWQDAAKHYRKILSGSDKKKAHQQALTDAEQGMKKGITKRFGAWEFERAVTLILKSDEQVDERLNKMITKAERGLKNR